MNVYRVPYPPPAPKQPPASKKRIIGTIISVVIVCFVHIQPFSGFLAWLTESTYAKHQRAQARIDVDCLREAALRYRANNSREACPTAELLRNSEGWEGAPMMLDPWGAPYTVSCSADDVTVASFGPDRKVGTADDIRAPR